MSMKFATGQIWRDGSHTKGTQTIVAVTDHPRLPIITQDSGGDVWAYGPAGEWHGGREERFRIYNLTTLVSDSRVTVEMDDACSKSAELREGLSEDAA